MKVLNVALASCLSLSVLSSVIGVSQRAAAQTQEPKIEFTGSDRSITKNDLDRFCEEHADASLSSATQPNGEPASPEVIQLAPVDIPIRIWLHYCSIQTDTTLCGHR